MASIDSIGTVENSSFWDEIEEKATKFKDWTIKNSGVEKILPGQIRWVLARVKNIAASCLIGVLLSVPAVIGFAAQKIYGFFCKSSDECPEPCPYGNS